MKSIFKPIGVMVARRSITRKRCVDQRSDEWIWFIESICLSTHRRL